MTRAEAAEVVEALEEYFDTRIAWEEVDAIASGVGEINRAKKAFEAARHRLIDRLCDEEPTEPLAGRASSVCDELTAESERLGLYGKVKP